MMQTPTLPDIEKGAKHFAQTHAAVADLVKTIEAEKAAVDARYERALEALVAACADDRKILHDLIVAAPELFEKPRTLVLSGVKVGFRKGAGGLQIENEPRTIDLIEKHLAEQADILIHTEKTVVLKALRELDVKDLMQIGCRIEGVGDVPVLSIQNETAKRVAALIKAALEKRDEEASRITAHA